MWFDRGLAVELAAFSIPGGVLRRPSCRLSRIYSLIFVVILESETQTPTLYTEIVLK
jgi:hypothetical protein